MFLIFTDTYFVGDLSKVASENICLKLAILSTNIFDYYQMVY